VLPVPEPGEDRLPRRDYAARNDERDIMIELD